MSEEERRFQERVVRLLDEDVAGLDGATRSRLTQARARALASVEKSSRWQLIPASGAVLASVIAAFLLLQKPAEVPTTTALQPEDLELLTTNENLELYRELDFYLWLEKEKASAG
jgi:hypothetical protein